MNDLLQKHGCANVFSVPEGLKELMSDITREVLRDQPVKIYDFIANYLSVLIITREHGIMAVKVLDDLCDCKPSVSEHLLQLGMERAQANALAQIIKEEIENFEPVEGKEKVREMQILKRILTRVVLDEVMAARVCQVARNAYRDYWYRKKLMEKSLKDLPDEPWEIAAERTLTLYKTTKPSFNELTIATQKIQAAYRGYYVRKNLLRHLKPKPKKTGPKVELLGPPVDVAASRDIELGRMIDLHVKEDDVAGMFEKEVGKKLGISYDPMKTITHIDYDDYDEKEPIERPRTTRLSIVEPSDMVKVKQSRMDVDITKSKQSRLDMSSSQSKSKQSRMDVDFDDAGLNEMDDRRESMHRRESQMQSATHSIRSKISFDETKLAEVRSIVDPNAGVTIDELNEALDTAGTVIMAPEAEVSDGVAEGVDSVPETDATDTAPEVPEDIPDNRTDDAQSEPTASVPSTAPDTANTTDAEASDVEDQGE